MKIESLRNKYEYIKDDTCITLYKVSKVTNEKSDNYGKEVRKLIGYYSGIEGVLKKLHFLELIEGGTVNDLLEDVARVNKVMFDLRKSMGKVG